MTITSGERVAEALEAIHDAKTDRERETAVQAFVIAERAHLAKLGVDVSGGNWLSRLLPVALIFLLILTTILAIGNSTRTSDLVDSQQQTLNASCKSGNVSRSVQINNLIDDATFYRDIAGPPPYASPVAQRIIAAADTKLDRAKAIVHSIPVEDRLYPNDPDLAMRSKRACDRVFPT